MGFAPWLRLHLRLRRVRFSRAVAFDHHGKYAARGFYSAERGCGARSPHQLWCAYTFVWDNAEGHLVKPTNSNNYDACDASLYFPSWWP
jgi:hypothetical protein